MVYNTMEQTAVLANPASGRASWRALYPSRNGFEGGGVGAPSLVVVRTLTRGCSRREAVGCVNTKNWYKEKTDLWAEFGKRAPFGKRFSSKHSLKMPAVGSTSSFGRRVVSRLGEEAFGNA
jgi:hypothetical protein